MSQLRITSSERREETCRPSEDLIKYIISKDTDVADRSLHKQDRKSTGMQNVACRLCRRKIEEPTVLNHYTRQLYLPATQLIELPKRCLRCNNFF